MENGGFKVKVERVAKKTLYGNRLVLEGMSSSVSSSVTILGEILDFGQLFKPLATINFPQVSYILKQFL